MGLQTDRRPLSRLMSGSLAGSCLGLFAAWALLEGRPDAVLNPAAPVALLSVFLAVSVGGLLADAGAPPTRPPGPSRGEAGTRV